MLSSNVTHDLRLVLVVNGRGVPPENVTVVESFPHVADIRNYIGSLDPTDQLAKSSTMLRYIEADVYYPGLGYQELSAKFDLRWLVDTGLNLGSGRQGLVRLMMIGGHSHVAVKVVRLAKRNRFSEEAKVWRHMAATSPEAIPRLYNTQTVGDFGIIVTEIGVPLTDIFKSLDDGTKSKILYAAYADFFSQFKIVPKAAADFPLTAACSLENVNFDDIKLSVFESLSTTVLPGLEWAGVIHRDLKLENLLYLPKSKRVAFCDFGISVITSDPEMKRGPRGALKYYPIRAIDDPDFYQA